MENQLVPVIRNEKKVIEWAELVLFLSDMKYLDKEKINELSAVFSKITVAGKEPRPSLPENINWHAYSADSKRSEVWNRLLGEVEKDWALFIEDDEHLQLTDFPDKEPENKNCWMPALIRQEADNSIRQFYQMRLVYAGDGDKKILFEGQNLPDCTQYIRGQDIEIASRSILITRKSNPFAHINIDEELSVKEHSPKLYLVQGERYLQASNYVLAAAQYRQLLKKKKLLPFDRLAGVNGLASCLAEQYKWQKALALADESLKAESHQALPYLIQFKIYELQKEWEKAHHILNKYHKQLSLNSKASFDKIIDEESTLIHLADIALRAGNRKGASNYFDQLFTIKTGNIVRPVLYKALVLSIELGDYERSVHLFNHFFEGIFPKQMDDDHKEDLNDIMTMFMKNKWYSFVVRVYDKLHKVDPEDQVYKRRLIVALTKTNRLDKAQNLLSKIV